MKSAAVSLALLLLLYPFIFDRPLLLGYRRDVSAGGDLLRRPGTSSAAMPARSRSATACSSAWAPMRRFSSISYGGLPPAAGVPARHHHQRAARARDRHADLPPAGPLFQHGDDCHCRADPNFLRHLGSGRRRDRPAGTCGGARLVGSELPQRAAVLLHLSRRAGAGAVRNLRGRAQPLRLLSACHQGRRARGAQPRRAGAARPSSRR